MNGAHDLGGMHGFGPVEAEPEATEPVFHSPWERRVFGLSLAAGFLGKWNVDMMRNTNEGQHPALYLRHSYYENWLATLERLLVDKGLVTPEELATGKAAGLADEDTRKRVLKAEDVAPVLTSTAKEVPSPTPPRFQAGDRVRAVNRHPTGHTRQPRYVRGRLGTVDRPYGVQVFPDRSALGSKEGQHLYSVRFEAAELWGPDAAPRSAVYVDLWQSYLEPAS